MKAFVMSAGLGTRLRPLTYNVPKPMITVANKPLLHNTIDLLKRHRILDIIVNLHIHPEYIKDYFGDGSNFGVNIKYSYEKVLMGTAGGVRKVSDDLGSSTFIVLSGDGLIDVDLSKVISFHKEKGAIATIVLKKYDQKFPYGVVFSDEKCRIKKFVEKPMWGDVVENKVNTGIYVLEPEIFDYIPKDEFFDFGNDVWPLLMEKNIPIYSYATDEYWSDIGDLTILKNSQNDVLEGKLKFDIKETEVKDKIWIGNNLLRRDNVILKKPCLIGDDCKLEENVTIGENTVVGNSCTISSNSEIVDSVIGNNVFVSSNVKLFNCIVTDKVTIPEGSNSYNGIILNN